MSPGPAPRQDAPGTAGTEPPDATVRWRAPTVGPVDNVGPFDPVHLDPDHPVDPAGPMGVGAALDPAGRTADPDQGDGDLAPRRGRRGRSRRAEWRRVEKARRHAARKSVRLLIFTRSILLWMLIFALAGLAFGASGAFWWANFNTQVSELREDTQDFEQRSLEAQSAIEAQRSQALAEIDEAIRPLQGFLSETEMIRLGQLFSPSVYQVVTLDEAGMPAVGTAFAVLSDDRQSFWATSFATVQAASVRPGPGITVRKGAEELPAELFSWDPERDLALLRVERGEVPLIEWAPSEASAEVLGTRVFPVSGLGGAGASLTTGMVVDQSAVGFQHTAPLGTAFQGGPIVDVDGKVVGVASLAYRPLGFDPGDVRFAVTVDALCVRLLACGDTRQPGPRS